MKNNKRTSALALAKLYNEWLGDCVSRKSDCTIRSYETAMGSFISYLAKYKGYKNEGFCAQDALSVDNIMEWIDWLSKECKMKPQSCNVRLSGIRSFLKYIAKKDKSFAATYIEAKYIERMKTETVQVKSLTKDAIRTLLSVPNVNCFAGMRDAVLMAVMYTTGCRINEALSIKISDLHMNGCEAFVSIFGKGDKRRSPYLPIVVKKNIQIYLKRYFSDNIDTERYLFFSNYKGCFCKLTQEAIRKRLDKYAQEANKQSKDVPVNFHPHQFRHSMAVHRLEDNMNIVQLSKELGHASIETTMCYLDVIPGKKEKAIAELESDNIKNLPRKWKSQSDKLEELFRCKY